MLYTFKQFKKVILPTLLLAIVVVGMQISCKKKSTNSTEVSLADVIFSDKALLSTGVAPKVTDLVTNLPNGVNVSFTYDGGDGQGIQAADYFVTAKFSLQDGFKWSTDDLVNAVDGVITKEINLTITDFMTEPAGGAGNEGKLNVIQAATWKEDMTIPATLFGSPVNGVGKDAFKGNTKIKTIKISEGITWVGGNCFQNTPNLTTVDFPATLQYLGEAPTGSQMFVATSVTAATVWPANITTIIFRSSTPPDGELGRNFDIIIDANKWKPNIFGTTTYVSGLYGGTNDLSKLKILVPSSYVSTYSNWWLISTGGGNYEITPSPVSALP